MKINITPNTCLQEIWVIGLIGKWFCVWNFCDNRKINLYLNQNLLFQETLA